MKIMVHTMAIRSNVATDEKEFQLQKPYFEAGGLCGMHSKMDQN